MQALRGSDLSSRNQKKLSAPKSGVQKIGIALGALLLLGAPAHALEPHSHDKARGNRIQAAQSISDNRPMRVAALFGKSDAEIAAEEAALQREQARDANIQSLNQRVQDLEQSVRRLTGQNETLGHRMEQMRVTHERALKDFEYRLCTISAQQMGANASGEGGFNCAGLGNSGGGGAALPPAPALPAATAPRPFTAAPGLAPGPGTLGTLEGRDINGPINGPRNITPAAASSASNSGAVRPLAAPSSTDQYNAAMNLLARSRFDEARSAFRGFADANPDDALTPQAVYWVGDIAYVQKDYPNAARAFTEQLKKYPKSSRAPDSMLKLGQSLIAMGQKEDGCTTLGALNVKYPSASTAITAKARDERKKAACR